MSGLALFKRAEASHYQGDIQSAFDDYQKAIKKILKDENVTAKIPAIVLDDCPQELLGYIWRSLLGFFRDRQMNFTEESDPDAFKLLSSFRPSAPKSHPRLERTPRGKVLLKGMQVTAGLTLGLLAWDKRDRATAAKRYQEALDLAETHPAFSSLPPGMTGLEKYVHADLIQVKVNLGWLIVNDTLNEQVFGAQTREGKVPGWRDAANLPKPLLRTDKTGASAAEPSTVFATDVCAACRKRDVNLRRCRSCPETLYCNTDCQKAHWPDHKKSCPGKPNKP
ncbi:hypothetical protein FPV67DRAFT_1673666 [Lyophyllum atratum]|nr:hypothetical protein FPV67DRAFT_1673666 [Lyophyllum atratum]